MRFVHIKDTQLQSHIQSNERCLSVRKVVTLVIFHYLSHIYNQSGVVNKNQQVNCDQLVVITQTASIFTGSIID